ncbi:YdcF family protein [Klebsiella pneumoniae subsp. pneumoniae]|nr:YdcF family protein [Klebsiella pneumoniae subsp. pneumoniae]
MWQANPGSKNDLYRRGGEKSEPRQHGGSRGESGGDFWRTSQRYPLCLDRPKDTEEEALAVEARYIGDAPFLPVTSASHLPRARHSLRHAGLDPLPAPANQLAVTSPLNPWERAIPSPCG